MQLVLLVSAVLQIIRFLMLSKIEIFRLKIILLSEEAIEHFLLQVLWHLLPLIYIYSG